MSKNEKTSTEKMKEALSLLDEAAREKKDELQTMMVDKYQNLKGALVSAEQSLEQSLKAFREKAAEKAVHVKDVSIEKSKEIAEVVDEQVHKNPWPYIGGTALAALLLGYFMGSKRK